MLTVGKYLLYYILGFILLYIDGINNPNEGWTIGQLWKVPVLLWLFLKIANSIKEDYIKIRFAFSLNQLLNVDTIINTIGSLSNVLKSLSLPLFLCYIEKYISYRAALKFILVFSQIIIVSFVPFWLGIIEERHTYLGAELLDKHALIGVFNNSHTASIYLSISTLILIFYNHYIKTTKYEKAYNMFIVALGCYFLLNTYVRTGYLMFLIGSLILFFVAKKTFLKRLMLLGVGLVFIFITGYFLVNTNKALEARLTEQTGYNEEESINGSGRFFFFFFFYHMWAESDNLLNILFGYGKTELLKRQRKENGLNVGSHNGFLDALSQNGIIGFSLLVLYYLFLFKYNYKYRRTPYYRLFLAWFVSDLSFQMVQGGVFIFYDVMSAVIIMLPRLSQNKVRDLLLKR